ncbi:MAG: hypothetical protein EBS53_14310 [Bacteroidetes bacterium]|nr:hypothetical protein [Bacteroidota bacterium]
MNKETISVYDLIPFQDDIAPKNIEITNLVPAGVQKSNIRKVMMVLNNLRNVYGGYASFIIKTWR